MNHLLLLGDSIFDNAAYVLPGQRDVAAHLRAKLPRDIWSVELRAVDGATTRDVPAQLDATPLPRPAVLVLSVGGNDALGHAELLSDPLPRSFGAVLNTLYQIKEGFRADYQRTLDLLREAGAPLIACTIYNPRFPEPPMQRAGEAALSVFNDVIIQECMARRLPVIDLRAVCFLEEHFANPIEPSELGGERIAEAIIAAVRAAEARR